MEYINFPNTNYMPNIHKVILHSLYSRNSNDGQHLLQQCNIKNRVECISTLVSTPASAVDQASQTY